MVLPFGICSYSISPFLTWINLPFIFLLLYHVYDPSASRDFKFFYEETDEDHAISVQQIIEKLDHYGISAARRSVYDDIRTLKEFGFDIIMQKNKSYSYFLGSRLFETAELKILIDSIQSSRFITKKKSEAIIKKLRSLASKPQSRQFSGQIYIYDRIKNQNECIFYSVDKLHHAIAENRKISFQYFD